jgi:hypothetical protein
MPNSYSGLFQTLAASFREASAAKVGKNVLMTMVRRDVSPVIEQPFATINTNIFASTGTPTAFTPGTTTLTLSDLTVNPGAVTLNQFPTYGVLLPSGDLSKTFSASFVEGVRDECVKKIGDSINGYIAGLITAANFPTNGSNSSGADTVSDAAMGTVWQKLAALDVPVGDLGNLFLATGPVVYANLLQTNTWTQTAYVGDAKTSEIRATARLGLQWGAICDFDPDMPGNGTGGTAAGTYASLLFHRNAIAMASRALAPPLDTGVPTSYVSYKGIPIRITVAWNNLKRADELVMDAMFGAAVVREDHGAFLIST